MEARLNADTVISELRRYEAELSKILSGFNQTRDGIYIGEGDDPLFRQYVHELFDLFNDALGPNSYSDRIVGEFNDGIANFVGSPSYKSVENILSIVRAAQTRLSRNPALIARKKLQKDARRRENIFIIHGRDEAKWRELKDIVQNQLRLTPIVLSEQPDAGCKTVIEKFEHYAHTCSYAIAVFTPDDEVKSGTDLYMQARPNVIYELGWFCGRLGRSGAMLLLKKPTELFSDFGGIVQKRFEIDVSEKTTEIQRDLVAAGILDAT